MFIAYLILLRSIYAFTDFNVIMCISNARGLETTRKNIDFAIRYTEAIRDGFAKPKHFALLSYSGEVKTRLNFTTNTEYVLETLRTITFESNNGISRPDICFEEATKLPKPNELPNIYLSLTDGSIQTASDELVINWIDSEEILDQVLIRDIAQVAYTNDRLYDDRIIRVIDALSGYEKSNQFKIEGNSDSFDFTPLVENLKQDSKLNFNYCTDVPFGMTCGQTSVNQACTSQCNAEYLPRYAISDAFHQVTCTSDGTWQPADLCLCVNPNTKRKCEIECEDGFGSLGGETEVCFIVTCPVRSLDSQSLESLRESSSGGCLNQHKCLECKALVKSSKISSHPAIYLIVLLSVVSLASWVVITFSSSGRVIGEKPQFVGFLPSQLDSGPEVIEAEIIIE